MQACFEDRYLNSMFSRFFENGSIVESNETNLYVIDTLQDILVSLAIVGLYNLTIRMSSFLPFCFVGLWNPKNRLRLLSSLDALVLHTIIRHGKCFKVNLGEQTSTKLKTSFILILNSAFEAPSQHLTSGRNSNNLTSFRNCSGDAFAH